MYEQEHRPDLYELEYDLLVDNDDPIRPDSHYASSKAFNEAQARYYVEAYEYPKQVYVLRIGSVRNADQDHPYADAEQGVKNGDWKRNSERYTQEVKRMKATWQSRRDAAHMIATCLEDDSVTYDIFYGISNNDRRWFDLEHAKSVLGYQPKDNGEDWDEPPI